MRVRKIAVLLLRFILSMKPLTRLQHAICQTADYTEGWLDGYVQGIKVGQHNDLSSSEAATLAQEDLTEEDGDGAAS